MNLNEILSRRLNIPDIRRVVAWAEESEENRSALIDVALNGSGRVGKNALWCVTHLGASHSAWLQSLQSRLIDCLLSETDTARKRMLLQLLRNQEYDPDSIRTDFLDYCLARINAECEPYAIRCFSLYTAAKMCRHYPELVAELQSRLDMLRLQPLSPGLKCAMRKVSRELP